jgi:hypothetical protein
VNTAANYTITYSVRDRNGNQTTATRTVQVVNSTPQITSLTGPDPQAQFKRTGTFNGTSGYGFLLAALDGQLRGGGTDGLRIKIWNAVGVVYDNLMGNSDVMTADNTEALGGGSIVIHQ